MFEELIPIINKSDNIGIFTHSNPDGDALGSSYAFKMMLKSIGKNAEVFPLSGSDLAASELILNPADGELSPSNCDLFVALDCAASARLGKYEDLFLSHSNTIAIDHHITHEAYAKKWVMLPVSSACEAMFILFKEMDFTVTKDIAHNLYIGLTSDTGNFKYESISPDTLRIGAELIETGIDYAKISKRIFTTKTRAYYALMQIALDRLEFFNHDRICILYLSREDFDNAGLDEFEATGIVTLPISIKDVDAGIYIRSRGNGEYKISLRTSENLDASAIASKMGGGGHIRAAGYSAFNTSIDQIIQAAVDEISGLL